MLRGIRDCMVLTEYSACTISRIHLFDDKFPTVGVHNLTNALGLRLAESGSKLLIVNAFKQLTLSLYAYWKERTQELVWIWKLNSSSLGASSPGALAAVDGGGVGLGVWRRRACNFVSGIWIPPPIPSVARLRLSCQISANQPGAEKSANGNKHWLTGAKGNDVIANVITTNQLFSSTFWMQMIKCRRRCCKLSFLFPPRRQTAQESLFAD